MLVGFSASTPGDPSGPGGRGGASRRREAAALGRAERCDELVREVVWGLEHTGAPLPEGVEIAAVGRYGRRTLVPHEVIQIRLLWESPSCSRGWAGAAQKRLRLLGVRARIVALTEDELVHRAQGDPRSLCELLDYRVVVGGAAGRTLWERHSPALFAGSRGEAFFQALATMTRKRYREYGASVYQLEPNLIQSAGGQMDVDVIDWIVRARFRVQRLQSLGRLAGAIEATRLAHLLAARDFLLRLRGQLHLLERRPVERLTHERQQELAPQLGYGSGRPAVEQLMRDYYRAARIVSRECEAMLASCGPPLPGSSASRRIEEAILTDGNALWIEPPERLEEAPGLSLRVYVEACERGLVVAERCRQSIVTALLDSDFRTRLRTDAKAAEDFVDLVCTARSTRMLRGSVLTELHEVGLLTAMIPEFLPVVGRVHLDAYHVHTVDVHSIATLDYVHSLRRGERTEMHRMASRVAAELGRVRVLCFAALLHDIGKVDGGEGHAARGAVMAAAIAKRLGAGEAESRAIHSLVLQHLRLYQMATKLDIESPDTLLSLAHHVQDAETLRELFVLTIADVTSTSPASMSSWKAQVLDDLFRSGLRHLTGVERARPHSSRGHLLAKLLPRCRDGRERAEVKRMLEAAPERYEYLYCPEVALEQLRFAIESQRRAVAVRWGLARGAAAQMWVVADDRPGLLRRIATAVHLAGLSVLRADVLSWKESSETRRCLDVLWVGGLFDQVSGPSQVVAVFQAALEGLLAAEDGDEEPPIVGWLDPAANEHELSGVPLRSEVLVDNRTDANATIVEVLARDRPCLLAALAGVFEALELSVESAKINTEGQRAIDVFSVRKAGGGKLGRAEVTQLRERLLLVL